MSNLVFRSITADLIIIHKLHVTTHLFWMFTRLKYLNVDWESFFKPIMLNFVFMHDSWNCIQFLFIFSFERTCAIKDVGFKMSNVPFVVSPNILLFILNHLQKTTDMSTCYFLLCCLFRLLYWTSSEFHFECYIFSQFIHRSFPI